jgi:hypothetical protein
VRDQAAVNSIAISIAVFAFTFAGAMIGLRLHAKLPASHLDESSKDVVKLVMGLVATISGLVLGLLISSAHRNYETQAQEVQQIGINIYQVDRTLEQFGPEASEARAALRRLIQTELDRASQVGALATALESPLEAQRSAIEVFNRVAALNARDNAQRFAQQRAMQLLNSLGETRLVLMEQARAAISWPFLVIVVFWLTVLFVGFGLFARPNPTIVVALFLGAMCVAGAIFLILEMNRPYTGIMQVSLEPIRNALVQTR